MEKEKMEKKVVEQELKKGLEATSQLRSLLFHSSKLKTQENEYVMVSSMQNHLTTILNSFDTSISILNKFAQSLDMAKASSSPLSGGQSKKRCTSRVISTVDTPNLTHDGYTWRKYGNKLILNTKHPREYYKCAYKDDHNKCLATKHVQKISDNPSLYRIIYYGHHTCQNLHSHNNAPNISVPDFLDESSTNYISFDSPSKQNLNLMACNLSSSSSSISKVNDSPLKSLNMTVIVEPSTADDVTRFDKELEVVYSPRTIMSPSNILSLNMGMIEKEYNVMVEDCYDEMDDALLHDLPLWD